MNIRPATAADKPRHNGRNRYPEYDELELALRDGKVVICCATMQERDRLHSVLCKWGSASYKGRPKLIVHRTGTGFDLLVAMEEMTDA